LVRTGLIVVIKSFDGAKIVLFFIKKGIPKGILQIISILIQELLFISNLEMTLKK
jgi:hypothetical protein